MKMRNGFVSNSSSSSYLVIVDKVEVDNIKDQLDPIEQAIVECLFSSPSKFLGVDCYCYSWFTGEAGNYMCSVADDVKKKAKEIYKERGIDWEDDDFFYDTFWDVLDNWFIKVPEGKYFYHSEYF